MNDSDEFDDMLKSLGMSDEEEPAEPESQPLPDAEDGGDVNFEDLDAQLEALMKADEEADDNFEPMEATPLVSTRSIYDAGGVIEEGGEAAVVYSKEEAEAARRKESKKSLFSQLTVKKLLIAGFVLFIIFVGGGATAVLASRVVAEQRGVVAAMSHFTPISIPENVANNANFIPINQQITVNGQNMTLSHIALGYTGSYFYFNEVFNPEEYAIILFDQARHLYVRQGFDLNPDPVLGTILRFDAIQPSTSFLTLFVQDLETLDYAQFYYRFVGPRTMGAPVYLNRPITLLPQSEASDGLQINHAVFSNVDSVFYYSFAGDVNSVGLRHRGDVYSTFLRLRDNFTSLKVLTEMQAAAEFPCSGAMIGRATFGPLMSLDSSISLTLRDLYYVFPEPYVDIPMRFLAGRDQSNPHTIETGPFRLHLEAIGQQSYFFIVVLHGTNEAGTRLPARVEASLRIDIGRGEYVVIPAYMVNVSTEGSDVVFNLRPYVGQIRNVHIDHYTLILHTAEFAVPEVTVSIDLARYTSHLPGTRRSNAVLAIESAFNARLAYMSGEIARHSITGFSPELLADEAVMAAFAPRTLTRRPMYNTTVVAGDFIDNYTFLAIVESEWVNGEGRDTEFIRTVHRVVAHSFEGRWSVSSDEIFTPNGLND